MQAKKAPIKITLLYLVFVVIFYIISFYFFDKPLSYIIFDNPQFIFYVLNTSLFLSKVFDPNHWVIIMILSFFLGIYIWFKNKNQKDLKKENHYFVITLAIFLALFIGTILKYTLARYRPELLFSENLYGFHFFSSKHSFNSTPSGHALANFSGLLSLAFICQKRLCFIIAILLAVIICIARLIVLDHFLSDVVFGAYIGIFSFIWAKWLLIDRKMH